MDIMESAYTVLVTLDGDQIYEHDTFDPQQARRIAETQRDRMIRFGAAGDYRISITEDITVS